jgi:iron complex outermembrane receptor protein
MEFFNKKLDITPGVATYFSDFNFLLFQAIGYQLLDNVKAYGNLGYTYRIPTFTDLNYKSPTTIGNSNLEPKAFARSWFEMEYI